MASVQMDGMLREYVPKLRLSTDARDVRSLLEDLEGRYPRLRFKIRDETGAVRRFMKVYVNGRDVSREGGLETVVGPDDTVDILHSIQGG